MKLFSRDLAMGKRLVYPAAVVWVQMFVLGLTGWIVGGWLLGLVVAAGVLVVFVVQPNTSPAMVMRLFKGEWLPYRQAPGLNSLLRRLAERAGLQRVPKLYLIDRHEPTAFTVGDQNEAAIAVSNGLINLLDREELAGVLAHELAHVRNEDMRVMVFASLLSRFTHKLSFFGQILLLVNLPMLLLGQFTVGWSVIAALLAAPLTSIALQQALSRNAEFEADAASGRWTGNPRGLASALMKIEQFHQGGIRRFFPFALKRPAYAGWLRTHPPTGLRVKKLLRLDKELRPPLWKWAPGFRRDSVNAG